MLVHTDREVTKEVCSALEEARFKIAAVDSGREALAQVYEGRADMIILAEGLPRINGDELLSHICRVSPIPIIVLGRAAEEWTGVDMLESGADVYMTSPLNIKELIARVRSLLRRSHRLCNSDRD